MKIAIFVNGLVNKGGVERIILTMAKHFDTEIFAGTYNPNTTYQEFETYNIHQFNLDNIPKKLWTLYFRYKFAVMKLNGFDYYISFGSATLNILKKHHPNIWYCNSPQRWMYDLYEHEMKRLPFITKLISMGMIPVLRIIDQYYAKFADKIFVNSINIQKRVTKYYGLNSEVLYPSVDIDRFKFIEHGDYYLLAGRLDTIKRPGLAINAFKKMPNKKLVVTGTGNEMNSVTELSKGIKNISILGEVNNHKLEELYGRCIASICLSYKEDFGLIPIESMSAGKPCIATNNGGFLETILHKKTGYLVDDPKDVNQVMDAVNWLSKEKAVTMKKDCENRVKLFTELRFTNRLKSYMGYIK